MSLPTAAELVSLCAFVVEGQRFALETHTLREMISRSGLRRVPLSPSFVAGITPYRGEVLTTVSLRALLGLPESDEGCVLVLHGISTLSGGHERWFGLLVDAVGGMVTVERGRLAPTPHTVGEAERRLFAGAYCLPEGLLIQLEPDRLSPGRLRETQASASRLLRQGEARCAHW